MDINEVLDTRQSTHGDFATGATISQTICATLREGPSWWQLTAAQKEALVMIAHKMARIVNGNPDFADHWVDVGGYAKLAEKLCSDYKEPSNG